MAKFGWGSKAGFEDLKRRTGRNPLTAKEAFVLTEALWRFPWAFPPYCDWENARRGSKRDWRPTQEMAIEQARAHVEKM